MNGALPPRPSDPIDEVCCRSIIDRWIVHEYARATSTNLIAARLPVWHAVRADVQTAGRGRFQRDWVSDGGGLWLSAVVPAPDNPGPGALLPLAAGLAVCDALRELGVQLLRMRWPNDIMFGQRKLAGLLIDQFVPGLAVVGLGLNVANYPEEHAPELRDRVIRLADLVSPLPKLAEVMRVVLHHFERVCGDWTQRGPDAFLSRINSLWSTPIKVEVTIDGRVRRGQFHGVDSAGRLRLESDPGSLDFYEPHQVELLREILT